MNQVGISLGWNCNSAVKGVELGIRKKKEDGYKTCVFDMFVSNYPNMVQCIKDDFKYLLDDNFLTLKEETNGEKTIYNTKYKFGFNHESPGHADLYIKENWPEGINHFVLDNYKNFKTRYNKRIDNFRSYLLDENNFITFLITRYKSTDEDLFELKNALAERYPNLKYKFHILDVDADYMLKHLKDMEFTDEDEEVKRILNNK